MFVLSQVRGWLPRSRPLVSEMVRRDWQDLSPVSGALLALLLSPRIVILHSSFTLSAFVMIPMPKLLAFLSSPFFSLSALCFGLDFKPRLS